MWAGGGYKWSMGEKRDVYNTLTIKIFKIYIYILKYSIKVRAISHLLNIVIVKTSPPKGIKQVLQYLSY